MWGIAEFVGIDIGEYSIKFAKIKQSSHGLSCQLLTYERIPEDLKKDAVNGELKIFITNLLKKNNLDKSTLVLHIPVSDVILRYVKLGQGFQNSEMEGAIELDIAPALPFSIDQAYFDFDEKPDANGMHLTIAARHESVDAKTDLVQNNKVKKKQPLCVDVDIFAYERLLEYLHKTRTVEDETIMLVDIACSKTRIYVFQKQRIVFNREQKFGGRQATDLVSDVYGVQVEDAERRKISGKMDNRYSEQILPLYVTSLAEQINLAIDFYNASSAQERDPINKILFVGGGSLLKGLMKPLAEYLKKDCSLLSLGEVVPPEIAVTNALAIGLSMRES